MISGPLCDNIANMDYQKKLAALIEIEGIEKEEIEGFIEIPKDAAMGDYSLPCFRFSKALRMPPKAISDMLLSRLPAADFISRAESVNGYLNFFLDKEYIARELLTAAKEGFGSSDIGKGKTVCIDYSSVNIAKPFHIGHLSTTVIGAALYRIFRFLGYNAVGINHLGDWGTQFGKLISAYRRWGDKKEIEAGGVDALNKLYVRFHAEAEKNPELDEEARRYFKAIEQGEQECVELFNWFKELTLAEVSKIYRLLGIEFDSYAGESFYSDKMGPVLNELEAKGLAEESEGALVVRLDEFGMPPCMLKKADGATLYATRDLAAAIYRKNTYDFYKCLYVVAYQQNLHFKQFFKVLELMGKPWAADLEHVAFGMVSLAEGAMSTRKGNVVLLKDVFAESIKKAREIIEEKSPELDNKEEISTSIGVGAVVFCALYNNRIKDIVFSFDKFLNFDGETAPYLQYTHARARSVLKKAERKEPKDFSGILSDEAFETVKAALAFPDAVKAAAEKYEPSILSRYLIGLAQRFNRFYLNHRIADAPETERDSRLLLTYVTAEILSAGLKLLGIEAPDRM